MSNHQFFWACIEFNRNESPGFTFPPQDLAVANSAMVDTQTAPEWIDSDVCLRCRTAFTFTNRKHHCRNCGQVFDQQCSSKSMPLPHFGITQEVRVCDGCYSKLTKIAEHHKGHRSSASIHGTRHRSARELADAELQRAIQLSLEEVGAAHGRSRPGYVPSQPSPSAWQTSEPPLVDRTTRPDSKSYQSEEDDPDLRAAIEASLREANAPKPSAPIVEAPRSENPSLAYGAPPYSKSYLSTAAPTSAIPSASTLPNYDLEPLESDTILTFSQTVEQVEAQGGRDISRYPAVNELFDKANGLRPKLAMSLDDTGRKESRLFAAPQHEMLELTIMIILEMLSEMHDKLSQAVKLYDKLLTEQVSHPTWTRSPPPVVASSYQPVQSGYNPVYQTVNGPYAQWAPSQVRQEAQAQPTSPVYQHYEPSIHTPRQVQSPQVSYFNPPSAQDQYKNHVGETSHAAQESAPVVEAHQQWHHHPQYGEPSQYSEPPQHPQQRADVASSSSATPAAPQGNAPQQAQAPQSPVLYQVATVPPSLPQSPQVSNSVPQYSTPLQQPIFAPSKSTSSAASGLSRHNTTSFASTRSHQSSNGYLSRHNTISAAHPSQAQQQLSLPHFPVAPTSAPQTFPMYGPPIPSGVPQPERKEALLIDL